MNANVNPVVATFVVLLAIAAGALWMWTNGKAVALGGPAGLRIAPSGHLFVQMQNQLLEHDAAGEFLRRHDLSAIGVNAFLGGFDFFADGTILLRRGPDPRSFTDNLRSFQRRENERPLTPATPDSGMARCNIMTWRCESFGTNPVDFAAAIGIRIDRNTDTVYLSDTTRHLLRKYSASGAALAEPAAGFRFPNALELHEDRLYVADTNRHVVRQVETADDRFGQTVETFDVRPKLASVSGRNWPSHFTRVGDEWWVNVMKTGMDKGEIYVFDASWQYLRRVRLPDNADPIALLTFGEQVLISDWDNDRVRRVSFDGRLLDDFSSTGLDQLVQESAAERQRYQIYAYAGIANIVLLIILLVAKGTDWRQESSRKDLANANPAVRDSGPVTFIPEPRNLRKINIGIRIAAILLVTIFVALSLVIFAMGNIKFGLQLGLPVLFIFGVFGLIFRYQRAMMNSSVRFDSDRITLRDHTGREASSPYNKIAYSNAAIVADEMAVFLGQPQMPIYDRDEIFATLAERVPADRRISEFKMQMKLIAIRHPQGMLIVYAFIAAFLVAGAMMVLDRL